MFGGLCALWMWKSEHYGLGLISDINVSRPDAGVNVEELKKQNDEELKKRELTKKVGKSAASTSALSSTSLHGEAALELSKISEEQILLLPMEPEEFVVSMHAQYGCGRSSVYQLPFLWMYLLNATASVLDIAL